MPLSTIGTAWPAAGVGDGTRISAVEGWAGKVEVEPSGSVEEGVEVEVGGLVV